MNKSIFSKTGLFAFFSKNVSSVKYAKNRNVLHIASKFLFIFENLTTKLRNQL